MHGARAPETQSQRKELIERASKRVKPITLLAVQRSPIKLLDDSIPTNTVLHGSRAKAPLDVQLREVGLPFDRGVNPRGVKIVVP